MPKLLVEVGVEDLPAEEAELIAQSFRDNLLSRLDEARVSHGEARLFWTLRRFALLVEDIAERQEDAVEEIRGPAASVALDPQGNLTQAALGFLRRYGASPADLIRKQVGEKEYLFLRLERPGRPTAEILREIVPEALRAIPCSKSMRWDGNGSFLRPIRWVVALLDLSLIHI